MPTPHDSAQLGFSRLLPPRLGTRRIRWGVGESLSKGPVAGRGRSHLSQTLCSGAWGQLGRHRSLLQETIPQNPNSSPQPGKQEKPSAFPSSCSFPGLSPPATLAPWRPPHPFHCPRICLCSSSAWNALPQLFLCYLLKEALHDCISQCSLPVALSGVRTVLLASLRMSVPPGQACLAVWPFTALSPAPKTGQGTQ